MFKFKNRLKKTLVMGAATVMTSLVFTSSARADISSGYLELIAKYTYATAQIAYYIEQYTYDTLIILNSWMLPDQSPATAALQSSFVNVTNAAIKNSSTQQTIQTQFMQDYFQGNNPAKVAYLNDLTYQTLLGQPLLSPDPRKQNDPSINPAYNYIKNAAGLNIIHTVPGVNWRGSKDAQTNYQNFYSTISAIETFNAFIISQPYAEYLNGGQLTQQQNSLMQQASNSDWFAQVASENIGVVLRQILMYNSQIYVVLIQLLQTQKQLLTGQAMQNTLMILGNQFNENMLLNKATGVTQ